MNKVHVTVLKFYVKTFLFFNLKVYPVQTPQHPQDPRATDLPHRDETPVPTAGHTQLSSLAYIRTERDASHETPEILKFVRAWMMERQYRHGLTCLELLRKQKGDEKRDDGFTPSIIHELSQACYTIALVEGGYDLPDVEALLCLNFTHDLGEEKSLKKNDMHTLFQAQSISHMAARANSLDGFPSNVPVWEDTMSTLFGRMAKKMGGVPLYFSADNPLKTDHKKYFESLLDHPTTVIAKFLDRIHNMATLIGVKALHKQKEYLHETLLLRDTLKQAAARYPQYAPTFTVMNKILTIQVMFTASYLERIDPTYRAGFGSATLPRLRDIAPLPHGLDPLHITQARALRDLTWRAAYKNPEPSAA